MGAKEKVAAALHGVHVDWAHAKLRELHSIEMFGVGGEDGQKYPCRTIQVLTVLDAAARPAEVHPLIGAVLDVHLAHPETPDIGDQSGQKVSAIQGEPE